jgi:trk system potassium uptake protein TrkA
MIRDLGINNNISPKDVVSSKILSYVRALENTQGSNVVALYKLVNDQIEALEFIAKNEEDDIYEKEIKALKVRDNCLIACIIRDGKVIIPNGMDHIELNDSVIVVTKHTDFDDLTDVFES